MNIVFYLLVFLLAVCLWFGLRWIFNSLGKEIKDMKEELVEIMKKEEEDENE